MMTLVQTLKWPDPSKLHLKLPLAGDPRRLVLDEQAFHARLSQGGEWQRIGWCINWFRKDAQGSIEPVPYSAWTRAMQAELHSVYAAHLNWYPTVLGGPMHPPVRVPALIRDRLPPNLDDTTRKTFLASTSCSEAEAFALFLDQVGHSIAVEQLNLVPWSVLGFDSYALMDLFDGRGSFSGIDVQGRYALAAAVPCRSVSAIDAVRAQGLLSETMADTTGQLLRWCSRLVHKELPYGVSNLYGDDDFQWGEDFFGYRGAPPVAAMLSGTLYKGQDAGWKNAYPGKMHWTRGCHSTAVLIQSVLRALNIPSFILDALNQRWKEAVPTANTAWGEHAACYFRWSQAVLVHADAPYDLPGVSPDILPFPPEALAIPAHQHFSPALAPAALFSDFVNRPLALIAAQFLTKSLVLDHWRNRKNGMPPGAATPRFSFMDPRYTIPWWEAERFGAAAAARLDALVEDYLGDDSDARLRADLEAIPPWSLRDTPE
jgi:hypothetical protein